MTDESEEIGIDELDWENAAVHVPLGVQIIKATETLGQDRDRWKAQAEQLQTQLEEEREKTGIARESAALNAGEARQLQEQLEQQIAVDESEIIKLAEVRGLAFALDHVGYEGLGNMVVAIEQRVKRTENERDDAIRRLPEIARTLGWLDPDTAKQVKITLEIANRLANSPSGDNWEAVDADILGELRGVLGKTP